jgi:isocitrate dehydrogenase
MGWKEVSHLIELGITETIRQKQVTYDLHRQMEGTTKLKTSEFAAAIVGNSWQRMSDSNPRPYVDQAAAGLPIFDIALQKTSN